MKESRAKKFMEVVQGKTSITQILLDMRKGLKSKIKNTKTNFVADGAVMVFDYEDGLKYEIKIKDIGKSK
jgi:hypothetical protein